MKYILAAIMLFKAGNLLAWGFEVSLSTDPGKIEISEFDFEKGDTVKKIRCVKKEDFINKLQNEKNEYDFNSEYYVKKSSDVQSKIDAINALGGE